jgi:hypothetical protein
VSYTRFLCFVINNFSNCFGRNIAFSCRSCSPSQLTAAPSPGSQHRLVPGLGYNFHSPPVVSPPIVSFSRGAARPPCDARHRERPLCAALHFARAAQRAWRLAAQHARSLCCPVRPCAARNRAALGTSRAAQGTRARRRSFLHPDNSARTRRRLSYRRHTQRQHATRRSSCSSWWHEYLKHVLCLNKSTY